MPRPEMIAVAFVLVFPLSAAAEPALRGSGRVNPGSAREETGSGNGRWDPETAPAPFRRLHQDLGDSFAGLFSRRSVTPIVVGLGAALAAAPRDDEVAGYFLGSNGFPDIDLAGDWITHAEVIAGGVGALLLSQHWLQDAKLRQMTYSMGQALVLNNALSFALKPIANRARPDRSSQFSFPSAHSSNTLVVASIADHYYGPAAGIPAYAVAAFVSLSRLQANEHFASDVIAGSVLGYIVARSVLKHAKGRDKESRLSWMPILSPAREEFGVELRFRP